jgi:transmembrane sensor
MAEIHQLPDAERALREASAWIARLAADDASDADRAGFEAWRAAHPRNARAHEEVLGTWQALLRSGPLVRAVAFGKAMDSASAPPAGPRAWVRAAAAAAIVAAISVGAWYGLSTKSQSRFETAIGEHVRVALPDGSSLELNSNSLAKVEYSANMRVIRLERGEAYFQVAHDSARPFWVIARESWVRAVGTAFVVYLKPTGLEVTVNEGTVKVVGDRSGRDGPSDAVLATSAVAVLTAGEQVQVRGGQSAIRSLEANDLARASAWRSGSVYFEDQPLGEVVAEMERYTSLRIEVADAAVRRIRVGGTFSSNPEGAEAMLTMLQDGFGLTVRRDGDDQATIEGEPTH